MYNYNVICLHVKCIDNFSNMYRLYWQFFFPRRDVTKLLITDHYILLYTCIHVPFAVYNSNVIIIIHLYLLRRYFRRRFRPQYVRVSICIAVKSELIMLVHNCSFPEARGMRKKLTNKRTESFDLDIICYYIVR